MINFIKKHSAFTLVELLVVIGIIMILVAVGMMSYANAQKVGRDAKRKADLKQIQAALEMMRADNGSYIIATNAISTSLLSLTTPSPYIQSLPADPTSGNYYYYSSTNGVTYSLCGLLENDHDAELGSCDITVSCSATDDCNYGVKNP